MQHYLILQYPYETIEIALCYKGKKKKKIAEHKHNAVRATIPNIQTLLNQNDLTLQDIACFGVNVGPGPYNTLRALLTMANGIHFAQKTPLINLSALQLLEQEVQAKNVLIILHAFLGHVFYRMKIDETIIQGGCEMDELTKLINSQKLSSPLITVGNGAIMHKQFLIDACGKNLLFSENIPAFNSLQTLAQATLTKLQQNDFDKNYVQPIYFDNVAKK